MMARFILFWVFLCCGLCPVHAENTVQPSRLSSLLAWQQLMKEINQVLDPHHFHFPSTRISWTDSKEIIIIHLNNTSPWSIDLSIAKHTALINELKMRVLSSPLTQSELNHAALVVRLNKLLNPVDHRPLDSSPQTILDTAQAILAYYTAPIGPELDSLGAPLDEIHRILAQVRHQCAWDKISQSLNP